MIFNLINVAYADAAPVTTATSQFDFKGLIPLGLFFVVMYFFLVRPQQKKFKQQADLITSLRRGDRIIAAGGIIGSIHKIVNDDEIVVEIAEDVRIRMLKSSVSQVLAKTEPISMHAKVSNHMDDDATHATGHIIDNVEEELSQPFAKMKKVVKNNVNQLTNTGTRQKRDVNIKSKKNTEKL